MDYEIKNILGSKMYLLKDDVGLSLQLMQHGIREEASTKIIQGMVKPDWIIIDIGANLGYYALLEAKLGGFVHAIEPVKRSFEILNKSIELNGYKNIKTYNLAIGSQNGTQNIIISHRNNWSTMLNLNIAVDKYKQNFNRFYKGIEKTETLTLDNFVRDNNINKIDFIRMDVEGYETEIIKKADYAFSLMPKGAHLTVEVHAGLFKDRKSIVIMLDKIHRAGFKIICGTWKDVKYKATWQQLSHRGAVQAFFIKDEKR